MIQWPLLPLRNNYLLSCVSVLSCIELSHYCSHSDVQVQRNWYNPSDLISSFYSHSSHLLPLTHIILLLICSTCMIRTIRSCLNATLRALNNSKHGGDQPISSYTTPGSIAATIRLANEILTALTDNAGQVSAH